MAGGSGAIFIPVKPMVDTQAWGGLKKTLAAGIGLTAGLGAGALKIGQSFDDMTDTIITGTGASGKALAGLEKSAKNVGKTTPSSFADIGVAIADVNTRLGLTGKPLETVSKKFLNLSRITGTDLATNIKEVSRVFGDWNVATKDQPKALDKLFFTSQSTGIGVDQLAKKVVQFGAPMRQFGFSFEESISIMGKWEKEGVNTEVVMAGMKAGLGKLSKAGKDPVKAFNAISKSIKNAGSTGEANRIAIETFGQRAGPDLAAAIREGRFEIDDMVKALDKSGGSIDDADKRTRDFAESWQVFKNKAMLKLEPIAVRVFDALSKGGAWMEKSGIPAFEKMTKVVQDNQTTLKVLTGIVVALTLVTATHGAVLAVTAAGGMVAYLKQVKLISTAIKVWTAVQWLLNAALRANPIGIVITILAALAAGLVIAYRKSDTFRTTVDRAWKVVGDGARWLWNKVLQPVFRFIVEGLGKLMIMWGKMLQTLGNVPGFGWAKKAGDRMVKAGEKAIQLSEDIKKIPDSKNVKVTADTRQAVQSIASVRSLLDGLIAKGNSFAIGGVASGRPPGRASGGPVKAMRPYVVGEVGKELFVPKVDGHIVPNHQLRAMENRSALRDAQYGGSSRGVTLEAGAMPITLPATATPEAAYAAAGGSVVAALSALGG